MGLLGRTEHCPCCRNELSLDSFESVASATPELSLDSADPELSLDLLETEVAHCPCCRNEISFDSLELVASAIPELSLDSADPELSLDSLETEVALDSEAYVTVLILNLDGLVPLEKPSPAPADSAQDLFPTIPADSCDHVQSQRHIVTDLIVGLQKEKGGLNTTKPIKFQILC